MINIRQICCLLFIIMSQNVYSFSWQDLWMTKDQQAQQLMQKGEFSQAEKQFQQGDWQAVAAYRARQYDKSAQLFSSLSSEQGYYNQGNALAYSKHYKEAIKAYDKALHLNPSNKDAQYNRKLVADLLKNEQNKQQNKDQNKDQKNEKNGEQGQQSEQDKQNQQNENGNGNENQQSQSQDKSQDPQNMDQQNQQDDQNKADNASSDEKKNEQDQSKSQNNKNKPDEMNDQQNDQKKQTPDQEKDQQDQQNQQKEQEAEQQKVKPQEAKDKSSAQTAPQSTAEREKQQARDQWLRLVPDEPGGLLRQKLLRDHLRRQHELQP